MIRNDPNRCPLLWCLVNEVEVVMLLLLIYLWHFVDVFELNIYQIVVLEVDISKILTRLLILEVDAIQTFTRLVVVECCVFTDSWGGENDPNWFESLSSICVELTWWNWCVIVCGSAGHSCVSHLLPLVYPREPIGWLWLLIDCCVLQCWSQLCIAYTAACLITCNSLWFWLLNVCHLNSSSELDQPCWKW